MHCARSCWLLQPPQRSCLQRPHGKGHGSSEAGETAFDVGSRDLMVGSGLHSVEFTSEDKYRITSPYYKDWSGALLS